MNESEPDSPAQPQTRAQSIVPSLFCILFVSIAAVAAVLVLSFRAEGAFHATVKAAKLRYGARLPLNFERVEYVDSSSIRLTSSQPIQIEELDLRPAPADSKYR